MSSFGDGFILDNLPRMHLTPEVDVESDSPEAFTERILQARLLAMWACIKKSQGEGDSTPYDPAQAQQLHDWLHRDFVDTLPPAFSITNPDYKWDERLRHLPKQRQLIRATVGESICHLFRPLLLLDAANVRTMPMHKQVLLGSQTNGLAVAAFSILDASTKLHTLMGAVHTRLPAVIIYPFEAAVTLALLCIKDLIPRESDMGVVHLPPDLKARANRSSPGTDSSSLKDMAANAQGEARQGQPVYREACIAAVEETLNCLQALAVTSVLAEGAAQNLARLLSTIRSMPKNGPVGDIGTGDAALLPLPRTSLTQPHSFLEDVSDLSLSNWLSGASVLHVVGTSDTTADDWISFELSDPWSMAQDGILGD